MINYCKLIYSYYKFQFHLLRFRIGCNLSSQFSGCGSRCRLRIIGSGSHLMAYLSVINCSFSTESFY